MIDHANQVDHVARFWDIAKELFQDEPFVAALEADVAAGQIVCPRCKAVVRVTVGQPICRCPDATVIQPTAVEAA